MNAPILGAPIMAVTKRSNPTESFPRRREPINITVSSSVFLLETVARMGSRRA